MVLVSTVLSMFGTATVLKIIMILILVADFQGMCIAILVYIIIYRQYNQPAARLSRKIARLLRSARFNSIRRRNLKLCPLVVMQLVMQNQRSIRQLTEEVYCEYGCNKLDYYVASYLGIHTRYDTQLAILTSLRLLHKFANMHAWHRSCNIRAFLKSVSDMRCIWD